MGLSNANFKPDNMRNPSAEKICEATHRQLDGPPRGKIVDVCLRGPPRPARIKSRAELPTAWPESLMPMAVLSVPLPRTPKSLAAVIGLFGAVRKA